MMKEREFWAEVILTSLSKGYGPDDAIACANKVVDARRKFFNEPSTNSGDPQSVFDLQLPTRARNSLLAADIRTVADLEEYSANDLMKIGGLGQLSLRHVREKMASIGKPLK